MLRHGFAKKCLAAVCLLCFYSAVVSAGSNGKVEFEVTPGEAVDVLIDGELFTTYNIAKSQTKPYFHPVYAPGKTLVVREEVFGKEGEQGNDAKTNMGHFHHKGIWIAIDSVNDGLNYWHEKDAIVPVKVETNEQGQLMVVNHWMDAEKNPLIKEETTFTFTPDRMIVCDLKLSAVEKPVTFGDTKEGMLAVRLKKSLRGLAGGNIVNAEGMRGEKDCWGKPSPWIDYFGDVEGKTVGVTLFDSPDNFRPSRYHVRGYGLFAINAFGEKTYSNGKEEADPVTLKPGKSVELRYGIYIHNGDTSEAKVAEQYKKFLKTQNED